MIKKSLISWSQKDMLNHFSCTKQLPYRARREFHKPKKALLHFPWAVRQPPEPPSAAWAYGHRQPIALPCRMHHGAAPHPAFGGVGGEPHRGGRGDPAAFVRSEGAYREQP
jgi:hypothetical protein